MSKDRPPSPRCTEKERQWRAILEEQKESELSLGKFAADRGLVHGTLSWWKGEIRRREAIRQGRPPPRRKVRRRKKAEPIEFAPVNLVDGADATAWSFEVALPGGAVVRVVGDFEEAALTKLVRVLGLPC